MPGIEAVVAFLGGVLALFSPCSALLLPAFFAYAFPSRTALLGRTLVFLLGLLTLFVPLGLGIGGLASVFLERRAELSLIAGGLLIAIGVAQFALGGFELPGAGRIRATGTFGAPGEALAATYTLGLVYGIGGFCSGPLLGGVLTIAGASGGALAGAALLSLFALGMALPLFVLALAWDRIGPGRRARLRGGEVQLGPVRRHVSVVVSSALFIVLGLLFVVLQGGSALAGVYAALGLTDAGFRLEQAVARIASESPLLLLAGGGVVVLLAVGAWRLGRRRTPSQASAASGGGPEVDPRPARRARGA